MNNEKYKHYSTINYNINIYQVIYQIILTMAMLYNWIETWPITLCTCMKSNRMIIACQFEVNKINVHKIFIGLKFPFYPQEILSEKLQSLP